MCSRQRFNRVARKLEGRVKLFGFIIFCSLLSACTDFPTKEEVTKILEPETTEKQSQKLDPGIEIYIDGSGSMKGFTNPRQPRWRYNVLIDRVRTFSTSVGPGRFFKFGKKVAPIEDLSWTRIKQPNFYSEKDTDLESLVRKFIARSSRKDNPVPRAFIVITDGIQSVPGRREHALFIDAILQAMNAGFEIHLFILKAEFDGEVYSESQGGIALGRYESSRYGERPFFVYIFSQDGTIGGEFKQYLKDVNSHSLNLSRGMIERGKVTYSAPYQFNNSKNMLQKYSENPPVVNLVAKKGEHYSSGYLVVTEDLTLKDLELEGIDTLRFCGEAWDTHMKKAPELEKTGEQSEQNKREVKKTSITITPIRDPRVVLVDKKVVRKESTKSSPTNQHQLEVQYSFRMNKVDYNFVLYNLSVCGYTPKLPGWIEDLSVGSDDSIQLFNKVPYFSDTIAAFLKRAFDKRSIGYAVVKEG